MLTMFNYFVDIKWKFEEFFVQKYLSPKIDITFVPSITSDNKLDKSTQ
jgi:hypothetical protein